MKRAGSIKRAFPVSSVWFGALVGPSMVSGAFAAVYFAPYGAWGLVLPLIAMGTAAVIVAFGVNGARITGIFEYSGYAGFLYGKAKKILSPILELYIIAAMVAGGSAVTAMGGIFFNSLFGEPVPKLIDRVLRTRFWDRLLRFFRLSALQNREFQGCFPKN